MTRGHVEVKTTGGFIFGNTINWSDEDMVQMRAVFESYAASAVFQIKSDGDNIMYINTRNIIYVTFREEPETV